MQLGPLINPSSLTVSTDDQVRYASGLIRSYCGWHIAPLINDTKTVDSHGSPLLLLPTLRMTAVSSVTVGGTALDSGDFTWSESGMLAKRCGRWPHGFRSVVVEFTHGYSDVPDELAAVCVAVAKRMPAQFASVAQEQAGGVMRTYAGLLSGQASVSAAWTAGELEVLERYRIKAQP